MQLLCLRIYLRMFVYHLFHLGMVVSKFPASFPLVLLCVGLFILLIWVNFGSSKLECVLVSTSGSFCTRNESRPGTHCLCMRHIFRKCFRETHISEILMYMWIRTTNPDHGDSAISNAVLVCTMASCNETTADFVLTR